MPEDSDPAPKLDLNVSVECPKCSATITLDLSHDGVWTPHCAACGWSATFAITFTL